jgi:hypothetical protein
LAREPLYAIVAGATTNVNGDAEHVHNIGYTGLFYPLVVPFATNAHIVCVANAVGAATANKVVWRVFDANGNPVGNFGHTVLILIFGTRP